jgi:predicted nucleotidyltransferase component of viral defense system
MTKKSATRNVGASVRARLLNLSRERGQPFELLLTRFALERLLYRLSVSQHRNRFVLKGALLVTTWFDNPHRPTRDLDLLGYGDPSPEAMLAVFKEICSTELDDGTQFDIEQLRVTLIREELKYGGLRMSTTATIAGARLRIIVDIGFGDSVEPGVEEIDLPVLLGLPVPRLRAYARETVIAEKFHAMVVRGRANSRMKDYYDLWLMSQSYEFDSGRLTTAITATFQRRDTPIPENVPDGLSSAFAEDADKVRQWTAFIEDISPSPRPSLDRVIAALSDFLMTHSRVAAAALRKRQ